MPRTYYAIGDVHGEAKRLANLHGRILSDIAAAFGKTDGADAEIVHLGDYVDRGPDSRGVIERVMALEAGAIPARALLGNHEQLMLRAYDKFDSLADYHWGQNGGAETIASYRATSGETLDWRDAIPKSHLAWLRTLPAMIRDEERKIAFVHAGIDPKTFPNCSEEIRIWTRSQKFFESWDWPKRPELKDWIIVHGHTPTQDMHPHVQEQRINIDTGAVYGGPLTCVVLAPGESPRFLQA